MIICIYIHVHIHKHIVWYCNTEYFIILSFPPFQFHRARLCAAGRPWLLWLWWRVARRQIVILQIIKVDDEYLMHIHDDRISIIWFQAVFLSHGNALLNKHFLWSLVNSWWIHETTRLVADSFRLIPFTVNVYIEKKGDSLEIPSGKRRHNELEHHHALHGKKITISLVIFNNSVTVITRVYQEFRCWCLGVKKSAMKATQIRPVLAGKFHKKWRYCGSDRHVWSTDGIGRNGQKVRTEAL